MEEKGKNAKGGGSFVRRAGRSGPVDVTPLVGLGSRAGPHGVPQVSTGLADLDEMIGGGVPVGGIVMVMEDLEAPHHMLLLRHFMAQGLAHGQPLLFASPLAAPRSFLGTLPGLASRGGDPKGSLSSSHGSGGEDLRIAWQYRRYFNERSPREAESGAAEYCSKFDLRKAMERPLWAGEGTQCVELRGEAASAGLLGAKCAAFLDSLAGPGVGRIALQSLGAPECMPSASEWDVLAFLHGLKRRLRDARAVALVTFPAALLELGVRWQHVADVLLSVGALRDDDRQMEAAFAGYRDMVGFLRVHRLASINTHVPALPAVRSCAIRVPQKKHVVIERLHLAPIDASGGSSGGAAGLLCAQPADATSVLDF